MGKIISFINKNLIKDLPEASHSNVVQAAINQQAMAFSPLQRKSSQPEG